MYKKPGTKTTVLKG